MKPKIGLVGTGQTVGIAHYHVVGLLADGRTELAAVYSLDSDGAARFLREHGLENARICASYAELLDCVDAVDICTPNHTHIEYVLSAIEAGKAILVEKPLALSAADSRRAVEALQTKNVFNMVGFVLRYAFVIQELRKLVRNDLGRVYSFQGSYGGSRLANPTIPVEWRMLHKYSGSGALGDFGSHLIDLAYFTAGLTFESVSGMTATVISYRTKSALREKGGVEKKGDIAGLGGNWLETGKIDPELFREIDVTKEKEFAIGAPLKKVKVLSNHPKGSYELVAAEDKTMSTLKVTDPARFWTGSKKLVVMMND